MNGTAMSGYILAVDPGNVQSAYTLLNAETLRPLTAQIVPNDELLQIIAGHPDKDTTDFAIEMVASYGMAVGETVFETVFWIGRFYAAAEQYRARYRIKRMDVKMNLCHNSRAKDANIRQALIDRFGDVGTKKSPGWFYGFRSDLPAWKRVADITQHEEVTPQKAKVIVKDVQKSFDKVFNKFGAGKAILAGGSDPANILSAIQPFWDMANAQLKEMGHIG